MKEFNRLAECETWRFITRHEETGLYICFNNVHEYREQFNSSYKKIRYFHEVVLKEKPRKFFLDLDYKATKTKEHSQLFNIMTDSLKMIIIDVFEREYDIMINSLDLATVESSGYNKDNQYKYSRNIILTTYSIPNATTFSFIGNCVYDEYEKTGLPSIVDTAQFKNNTFNNRLPYNTKLGENRYKKYDLKQYKFTDLILTYVEGLEELPEIAASKSITYATDINDKDINDELEKNLTDWKSHSIYKDVTGNFINFTRIEPSYCSLCSRTHDNDNTFYIIITKRGYMYKCRRSKDILHYTIINDIQESYYIETYNEVEDDIVVKEVTLDGDVSIYWTPELVDYEIDVEFDEPRMLFFKVKTNDIDSFVKKAKSILCDKYKLAGDKLYINTNRNEHIITYPMIVLRNHISFMKLSDIIVNSIGGVEYDISFYKSGTLEIYGYKSKHPSSLLINNILNAKPCYLRDIRSNREILEEELECNRHFWKLDFKLTKIADNYAILTRYKPSICRRCRKKHTSGYIKVVIDKSIIYVCSLSNLIF